MSLSATQIGAQLDRVLVSDGSARVVAIRAASCETWPESLTQQGRQFVLRWCPSSLAIREAICDVDRREAGSDGLIVLTPLRTHEIGEDIAARLARARVFEPGGWDLVRQLFQAKEIDARLGRYAWMPQTLIDAAGKGPYSPVASGFLDLDTSWREVLQRLLGLSSARPDAAALLSWSMTASSAAMLHQLADTNRADILRWLAESVGTAGGVIVGTMESAWMADAVPLGLVCGVIFSREAEGSAALGQAAIRLERFVGDRHVGLVEGRAWAEAAALVVRMNGLDACRSLLDRADDLLREVRADDFGHVSDLLPSALDVRLTEFARSLVAHFAAPSATTLDQVERLAERSLGHALLDLQQVRKERVEMARRLARWITSTTPPVDSFESAALWQADQGAFVDWARFRLLGGDEMQELSTAYAACRDAVISRKNTFAESFTRALTRWNARLPEPAGRLVPVEHVITRLLGPIAAEHPTLLLVMDGLSISIFRELFSSVRAHGWMEWVPEEEGQSLVGLAALPTVTEVSRASLLCGRLAIASAMQEKAGFGAHPALLACCRADAPPRLFHKGDLADASNLSAEVRAVISDPQQRVVGVVYNAVDDHLSGPEQLQQRWVLEDLRLLLPLLHAAREARRIVVVTADHGHVLEDGSARIDGGESDRWRPGDRSNSPQEVMIKGGRVVTGDGTQGIVALWDERTRYAGRKNGYHGGLSPQEVTVPLSVLLPLGLKLTGWKPALPASPEWWDLTLRAEPAPLASPAPRAPGKKRVVPTSQLELFEADEPAASPIDTEPDWISTLLASSIYRSQRLLAARVALPDDQMRQLVALLSERGGKLSRNALAQRLSVPDVRLGGLLSAARRLLNVDQAPILSVDESTGTVELNSALLKQQFHLDRPQKPL